MFIRLPSLIVSLTAVASGVFAPAAVADEVDMGLQAIDASRFVEQLRRDRPFLQKITNPRLYPADQLRTLRVCRDLPRATDCVLISNSNGNDGAPTTLPEGIPDQPGYMDNMLVTFWHKNMFLLPQSGSVFEPPYQYSHTYTIDSSISSSESPWEFHTAMGTSLDWSVMVWRAVILGGCSNPPAAIPIDFSDVIKFDPNGDGPATNFEQVAEFHATDNTTLNGTGFWNYQFAVDANASDGSTAVIDVQGTVSVTCTDQGI